MQTLSTRNIVSRYNAKDARNIASCEGGGSFGVTGFARLGVINGGSLGEKKGGVVLKCPLSEPEHLWHGGNLSTGELASGKMGESDNPTTSCCSSTTDYSPTMSRQHIHPAENKNGSIFRSGANASTSPPKAIFSVYHYRAIVRYSVLSILKIEYPEQNTSPASSLSLMHKLMIHTQPSSAQNFGTSPQ